MISYEELDERLKRIMDDGSASAEPAEMADLRAQLALEPDKSGDMPRGTKVAFDEVPDVAAPTSRMPLKPRAATSPELPPQARTVDLSMQPPGDMDAAYARAQDRHARQAMARERGGRELVAGLTRTAVQPVTARPVDAFDRFVQTRKEREGVAQHNEQNRLGAAKLNYEGKESARKAALDAVARDEGKAKDERDFTYRQQHDAAQLAQQKDNADASRRMAGAGLGIRQAAEQREVAKDARGRDLPASSLSELSELPVAEAQVDAAAEAFSRLGMGGSSGRAAGAVTDALDLKGTDAAEYNAAVTLAMQAAGKIIEGGKLAAGDEAKYRRMMPAPGNSPAVVKQKTEGMKVFLRDLARRRGKAFKDGGFNVPDSLIPADEQASGPAQAGDGKVTISNGKETVRIPLARLADAERDGFKRVQ